MECYTQYVNRVLRFYARNPAPTFKTEADKLNWQAADKALSELGEAERKAVIFVFATKGSLPKNAVNCGLPPHKIWRTISDVSRKIARERGLI